MKWKLDENFGSRTVHLFLQANHEADTVLQEDLGGATDEVLFEACAREDRCLVTLDIDFADVLRFPPHRTVGMGNGRCRMGGAMGGARHGNGWLAPKDEKCAVPGGNCHMDH